MMGWEALLPLLEKIGFPVWALVVLVLGVITLNKLGRLTSKVNNLAERMSFMEGWVKRNGAAIEHIEHTLSRD